MANPLGEEGMAARLGHWDRVGDEEALVQRSIVMITTGERQVRERRSGVETYLSRVVGDERASEGVTLAAAGLRSFRLFPER